MGTRLGALTAGRPKCQLTFRGASLLQQQVATLRAAGIEHITVVRGYAAEQIVLSDVEYAFNPEFATTNMVATLLAARSSLLAATGKIIVSYADILYEPRLVRELLESPAAISVLTDDAWLPYWQARSDGWEQDVESLKFDSSDRIYQIGTPHSQPQDCHSRYIGLISLSPGSAHTLVQTFDELHSNYWTSSAPWRHSKSFRLAYFTCFPQELIDRGIEVRAVRTHGGWLEFDTAEDYERALLWHREGTLSRFIRLP